MKVMVVGSGGREHALAWRLSQDTEVTEVLVYPGNPGMASTPKLSRVPEIVSLDRALALIKENGIGLVVIGPEKFLFEAWVDQLQALGIPAYGPSQAASFLEESKIQSKVFMREHLIETAPFEVAHDLESAQQAIESHPEWAGYVLKLSGPALGKGVIVTRSKNEAFTAAEQFFKHCPPGIEEGMVIEALVHGREVSLFYVCSGNQFRFLASACDHKRLNDGDQGPNTGGMGAYSPCFWIDQKFLKEAEEKFVIPTLAGMKARGTPFSGTLFLGLMVKNDQASLLEYNVRFGDPETQTFLPLLKGSFAELLLASARGSALSNIEVSNSGEHALHIVKAARGYPGLFGVPIESGVALSVSKDLLQTDAQKAQWFFAGVSEQAGTLKTSGGRVCGITAKETTLAAARALAYGKIEAIHFEGEHYRRDIGGTP